MRKRSRIWTWVGVISSIVVAIVIEQGTALVAIQPLGAIPHGITLWVWRDKVGNFLDSPDGLCLRRAGEVSLMCRTMAMMKLSGGGDRIILRLPYSDFIYLHSTGGQKFDS